MHISEQTLLKVITYGVYAALFLPLVVIPWLIFPFATSRGFLFQIIVEIIFALYCVLAVKNPAYRPKRTLLFGALFFYCAALLLSTFFGLDFYHSFFGNYERMWGLFQLAHFFLFFIVLAGVFKNPVAEVNPPQSGGFSSAQSWRSLLRIALFAGFLVIAGGIYQFASALLAGQQAPRVSSTIGNPAFLASYLLFALFFNYGGSTSIVYPQTLLFLGLSVLSLITIFAAGTRGVFVGLAAAGVTGAVLLLIFSRRRWVRFISALCVGAVVVGAFLLIQYGSLFEKPERISQDTFYSLAHFDAPSSGAPRSGFLSRLTDLSIYDTTTLTRLATWKTVLASAKDYPLFGAGPENFILAFNKYFNSEFYSAERSEIWFDRAHNAYIDMLVMHGIFGLTAYLFLYAVCFFSIFQLYRRRVLAPAHACVFTLFFVAYGVQNFFLFDSFGAFLMWIVALAYLNSFLAIPKVSPLYKGETFGIAHLAPLLVVAAVVAYAFSVRPMMQSYLLAKAESGQFNIDTTMALYEKALSWRTFGDNETRSRLALTVAKEVQRTETEILPENLSQYLDRAIAALKENIAKSNQYYLLYRLQLSDVYNLKLSRTALASKEIEDIVEKSIALSPGRMEFEFALAQTAFLKNEYQKAIDILQKASKKNPDHPMPYWKIAQNYHFMGQDEKGIPYVEKAFYLGFGARSYKELQWVAEYYNAKQDYVKIVFLNKKIIVQAPELVWPHMNLAIAYANLGQKDKAKEHAQKVGELNHAQQPAVDNFLKSL